MTKESKFGRIYFSGVASREDKDRDWKRVLIFDDVPDSTTTFQFGIEDATKTSSRRIVVDTHNDPRITLLDFQPNFYDLLLIDVNIQYMNGFQFAERILEIDNNVKICYMSSGEINRDALGFVSSINITHLWGVQYGIAYLMKNQG